MKAGDLVKRKGKDWIGLVLEMKNSNGYIYPEFVWLDTPEAAKFSSKPGEIETCSPTLLEVISEAE